MDTTLLDSFPIRKKLSDWFPCARNVRNTLFGPPYLALAKMSADNHSLATTLPHKPKALRRFFGFSTNFESLGKGHTGHPKKGLEEKVWTPQRERLISEFQQNFRPFAGNMGENWFVRSYDDIQSPDACRQLLKPPAWSGPISVRSRGRHAEQFIESRTFCIT